MTANTATHKSPKQLFWALVITLGALFPTALAASPDGGFTGGVTPSRFEIDSNAGGIVRRSIEIYNLGERPAKFQVSTSDWDYSPEGKLSFSAPLQPDSCRPWVRLESHEVEVVPDPRKPRPFRFEVHIPQDAKPQECRFALMVESLGSAYTTEFADAGIKLPVTGKIGIIVYLAIDGVEPDLVLEDMELRMINGQFLPVMKISNTGLAHGRLDGDIAGEEASGTRRPLSVATSPILAGQTRYIALTPVENTEALTFPLKVQGKVYTPNSTFSIDSVLTPPSP